MPSKIMERFCPDCGLALLEQEAGAGCPHCLFRLAMGDEPGNPGVVADQPPPPPGLRSRFFGDYELLSEVARGGMGVIYRARQISLNRAVALKMIAPGQLSSPEAWLRFQTEIAASAQLHHPNIVALYETGTAEGMHFFTMRLLEGNLATRLAGQRKAANGDGNRSTGGATRAAQKAIAETMIKVARAVHYAHQRGVLHRDLKPSNILLDDKGEPHVADFGLAKILAQESAATLTDTILGSPNYMAPEQANTRARNVTVETDVYGVGTVLYEALTGVPPFQASTPVDTIRKVLDEEPVRPRKLNPALDTDLETICLKCLQKNPANRYRSAEELAADLERWIQRMPILARPVGPIGAMARWSRRHPALATVSALLLLTIVGVAVGASIAVVRIRSAEQAAVERLRESLLDQVRVLRSSQAAGGRTEGRQLLRQAAALGGAAPFRARLRDELLATLSLPEVEFTALPDIKAEGPMRVLMDPAMKQLAQIVNGTNLVIVPLSPRGKPRALGHTAAGAQLEAFSADGRYLAVRSASGLDFYDVESGRLAFPTVQRDRTFCFATHQPLIALEEEAESEVSLRELPTGREIRRFKLPPDVAGNRGRGFVALTISPDGSLLACARASDGAVEMMEIESGKLRWRTAPESYTLAMAWQPSRDRLIISMSDGRYMALRVSDGASALGFYAASSAQSLSLHDASGRLAAACSDRRIRIWDLESLRIQFETECDGRYLGFDESAARLGTVVRGERVGWVTFKPSPEFKESVVTLTSRSVELVAYSGKGDLIAIGYPGRISLVNSSGRGARGGVNLGGIPVMAMDSRGEFILTSDAGGVSLRQLPELPSQNLPSQRRLVIPGPRWRALAVSADGSRVWAANASSNMIYAFSREFVSEGIALGPHEFVDAIAVSPDGRWVAGGSSLLHSVKVWDIASQTAVLTMDAGRHHRLTFSGDNRWLAVHGDLFELRRVGSWEPAPPLPYPGAPPALGSAAFSPDGRILAVVEEQENIRLFDLVTWKFLGLLRAPVSGSINGLAFSPDSTTLAAACGQGRLRTWNLQAIRRELAALNLDWSF